MKTDGLTINHSTYKLASGHEAKIAIFLYTGTLDPKPILDSAVEAYVGTKPYHELIDAHLDNPWMRVVLSDINGMEQAPFDTEKHSL